MSRYDATGQDPVTGRRVNVSFGWDHVIGFEPGYFFQVFDPEDADLCLVNEGFLEGITMNRLRMLKKEWKVGCPEHAIDK